MKIDMIAEAPYIPTYASELAAGADVRAKIDNPIMLVSLDRRTIPTGVKMGIPEGYEVQVRPRSGLASKFGIVAVVGTIDADYRGEIGVTLINLSREPYTIQPNERIGQLVLAKVEKIEPNIVDTLDETARGEKGFGSTGKL